MSELLDDMADFIRRGYDPRDKVAGELLAAYANRPEAHRKRAITECVNIAAHLHAIANDLDAIPSGYMLPILSAAIHDASVHAKRAAEQLDEATNA